MWKKLLCAIGVHDWYTWSQAHHFLAGATLFRQKCSRCPCMRVIWDD